MSPKTCGTRLRNVASRRRFVTRAVLCALWLTCEFWTNATWTLAGEDRNGANQNPAYHAGSVSSMDLNGDETVLTTVSYGRTMVVWDTATASALWSEKRDVLSATFRDADGRLILLKRSIPAQSFDVTLLYGDARRGIASGAGGKRVPGMGSHFAVSADGGRVVSVARVRDGIEPHCSVRMYDTETVTASWTRVVQTSQPTAVVFNPTGTRIVIGTADGEFIIVNAETGDVLKEFRALSKPLYHIAWSRDGTHLLYAHGDVGILCDIDSGDSLVLLNGHEDTVMAVAVDPTGSLAATGDFDGRVVLWDRHTGERQCVLSALAGISALTFSQDGKRIFGASDQGCVTVWNVESGAVLKRFGDNKGEPLCVSFDRDGGQLVAGYSSGVAVLWDVGTARMHRVYRVRSSSILSATFSADGQSIIAGVGDMLRVLEEVRFWDANSGRTTRVLSLDDRHQSRGPVEVSCNGNAILAGGTLWDVPSDTIRWSIGGQRFSNAFPRGSVPDEGLRPFWVRSGSVSEDGQKVLLAGSVPWGHSEKCGVVALCRSTDGLVLHLIGKIQGWPFSEDAKFACFRPGSEEFVVVSSVGVSMWKSLGNTPFKEYHVESGTRVTALSFNADGETMVVGLSSGKVALWHTESGEVLGEFEGHTAAVTCIAYSPDERYVVSGSKDRSLILWDASGRREVRRFRGNIDVRATERGDRTP